MLTTTIISIKVNARDFKNLPRNNLAKREILELNALQLFENSNRFPSLEFLPLVLFLTLVLEQTPLFMLTISCVSSTPRSSTKPSYRHCWSRAPGFCGVEKGKSRQARLSLRLRRSVAPYFESSVPFHSQQPNHFATNDLSKTAQRDERNSQGYNFDTVLRICFLPYPFFSALHKKWYLSTTPCQDKNQTIFTLIYWSWNNCISTSKSFISIFYNFLQNCENFVFYKRSFSISVKKCINLRVIR